MEKVKIAKPMKRKENISQEKHRAKKRCSKKCYAKKTQRQGCRITEKLVDKKKKKLNISKKKHCKGSD